MDEDIIINVTETIEDVVISVEDTNEDIPIHLVVSEKGDQGIQGPQGEKGDPQTREGLGLGTADTPEFADTQITGLNTSDVEGGEITPALWSWIVSVFAGIVPKSVKSHISGIWGYLNALATRVGILEDGYLLKYVVPADCSIIDLATDRYGRPFNFSEGDGVEIVIQVKAWVYVSDIINSIGMRLNGLSNAVFLYNTTATPAARLQTMGTYYRSEYCTINMSLIGSEVQGFMANHAQSTDIAYVNQFYVFNSIGLNITNITSFQFMAMFAISLIPAGAIIIIRKK